MTAHREIALFLDMMAAERGAAANTLDAYRRDDVLSPPLHSLLDVMLLIEPSRRPSMRAVCQMALPWLSEASAPPTSYFLLLRPLPALLTYRCFLRTPGSLL